MFGKHFESTYEGSLVGAGSHVFAVWGYVIAKQRPDKTVGSQVDLNPRLLSSIIGDTEERMAEAIEFLCSPDPESRTDKEDGRRLIRLGQFSYQVVNGAKYRAIRDEEARKEQNRQAQRRYRLKKKPMANTPLPMERAYEQAIERGEDGQREIEASSERVKAPLTPPVSMSSTTSEALKMDMPVSALPSNGEIPIPEIGSGPIYPVQDESSPPEPPTETGKFIDGEWVPD